jgi:hypothetical protein
MQWHALCGRSGLLPITDFAARARDVSPHWYLVRFPSLFWISQSDGFAWVILGAGVVGGLLIVIDRARTLGLTTTFAAWLTIVNFGGDFFAYPWDTLLLELGFGAIFLSAFRNDWPCLRLALAAVMLSSFRLWFSMGMDKLLFNNTAWASLEFSRYFYPNQPMPTPVAWHLAQLPEWTQQVITAMTLGVEVIMPLLLVSARLRSWMVLVLVGLSVMIQLSGNFAWFNLLAIAAMIPFLIGTPFGSALAARLSPSPRPGMPESHSTRLPRTSLHTLGAAILVFQIGVQAVLIVLLFFPVGNRYLNFLNYVAYREDVLEWEGDSLPRTALLAPLRLASNFRIANPMGVFKGIAWRRWDVELQAAEDEAGQVFRTFAYRYKPGAGNPPLFFAPMFPRFEQQLFYEAQQGSFFAHNTFLRMGGRPAIWTQRLLLGLWDGRDLRAQWFDKDPLAGRPASSIRVRLHELTFATSKARRESGAFWEDKVVYVRVFASRQDILREKGPLIPDDVFLSLGKHQHP